MIIYIYIFVQVMLVAEKLPPFIHGLSRSLCWIGNGQCPNTLPQWYDPLPPRVTRGDPQETGPFPPFLYISMPSFLFVCLCMFSEGGIDSCLKMSHLCAVLHCMQTVNLSCSFCYVIIIISYNCLLVVLIQNVL